MKLAPDEEKKKEVLLVHYTGTYT